jgi:hypothetical protein
MFCISRLFNIPITGKLSRKIGNNPHRPATPPNKTYHNVKRVEGTENIYRIYCVESNKQIIIPRIKN